ncbi:MAG: hypothetical protein RLZZ238_1241 [Planctomycetota bacterium]
MPEPTIRKPLPCAKCGYDLEGLGAHANCPECGHEVMATLAARLDPAAESLERTGELARTAWAIYLMSVGSLLGCAIAAAPSLDAIEATVEFPEWLAPALHAARALSPAAALVGCILGFCACVLVLPWSRDRPFVRARGVGALGFAIWSIASLATPSWPATLAALAGVALVAASVTPLLRRLVPHSRLFRTARHATQTTREILIASAVSGASGVAALLLSSSQRQLDEAAALAGAVAGAAGMLVVVGLAYRAANAYWVLRSVRRPPPRVDELLGE